LNAPGLHFLGLNPGDSALKKRGFNLEMSLEREVGELLIARKWTLGTVESATGGLISNLITNVPGSSRYYQGSIITYASSIKVKLAGVTVPIISKYGEVSARVAEEMARGGRQALGVDICLADTGIAGPEGASAAKPVGLFYFGLSDKDRVESRRHIFSGDRIEIKHAAAITALEWLKEYLLV
jgi:nicotinamide-nucleotide amidase